VLTLDNKVIWITGASGGIGSAAVRQARALGARCVAQSRRPSDAGTSDDRCVIVTADIGTEEGVAAGLAASQAHFGQAPDLLCHAVGAAALGALARTSLDQWNTQLHANATTAFLALRGFAAARGSAGAALLFSSVAAGMGTPNHVAVAAAKGAVEALVRAAATDLASKRIRVNALALGLTDTPMTAGFIRDERSRAAVTAQYPLGRYGNPNEVAAMALWLLSDQCAWVTGQILPVDGGFSAIRPMVR
jgi:NAD(P)-dependent dehydrogenase (short-subunit alcohol dehydrogenase family)